MDPDLKAQVFDEIIEAFEKLTNDEKTNLSGLRIGEGCLTAAARAAVETVDVYLLGLKHGEGGGI